MKNIPKSIKTGALYIRVSTDKQEELSPDAQKRLLLSYAVKNNIIITDDMVFIESGISGKKADKRPQFMQMIGLAKQKDHPIDVILVWKYSRFARNQEESIVYKSLLKRNNVDVISVSEPTIEGPFGSLIERIIEWMDEYYSIRLSGEVTRGMTEKALRGGYQARPPLGYRIDRPKEPPVIIPEEAEVVRKIFDLYVNENMSIFDICQKLNSLGLKTSHGKNFEKRSIEYILQNPTYVGKIRWNRTTNATNEIKDKSEWIIVDGSHEAIVSNDIFDAANEKFEREYHPRGSRPISTQKHWLSGLLKCASCGRSLAASHVLDKRYNKVYWNFRCYGYSKGKCSVTNAISESKATAAILSEIENFLASNAPYFEIKHHTTVENYADLISTQLSKLDAKEARIKSAYINGIDSLEEYKQNKELIATERKQLQAQLETQSSYTPDDVRQDMINRVKDVYNLIQDDDVQYEKKSESIRSIIDKIVVDSENKSFDVYFYFS